MSLPNLKYCPGTLKGGYDGYSPLALKRVFKGKKVSPVLPYSSPSTNDRTDALFLENTKRMSISGVQEKFSVLLEKNKLRLVNEAEQGTYILKPVPNVGTRADQMPANEHLTMQIARQVYGIETAENALMFFENGAPAYITKRFDVKEDGHKRAQEDFASLALRSPQTHGTDYKYLGSYLELFDLLKKHTTVYQIEAVKLFKLIVFNYLFSNGDAHFKNFSLLETPAGDFILSPAYDLLNSRIHIDDKDFALDQGLLPPHLAKGKVTEQLYQLAKQAGVMDKQVDKVMKVMLVYQEKVALLIHASFLNEKTKKNYLQAYQTRLKKLNRG